MDNYIANLRRETAEKRAQRQAESAAGAERADPRAALKGRIREWYRGLAPEARPSAWHMEALVQQLRATPQHLGVALEELGWMRGRVWRRGRAYRQHWRAPAEWNQ